MRLRNLLFAPGDSARKRDKALASAADAVVLDLEDAVGPDSKDEAREQIAALLPGRARREVVVRVNARTTPWYLRDLAAVVPGAPMAVMLPKCTGMADILALDHHLEALETAAGLEAGQIGVLALVTETAASLHGLDYRNAPPRLKALCFGAEDLSSDLGVVARDDEGRYAAPVRQARAAMLLAAGAAGLPAIDTPFPDPRRPEALAREAAEAARDGFAGKLCIHPDQIGPVAAAFTPDAARLDWAAKVVAAFTAQPEAGVISLEGQMVEGLHLRLARRILDAAR
ncbi:HpcH/HpaI aldolase/citrate lyase family protein [Pseudoroseomonas ludipueritiae]|uniref:CoA ester lyase n=1 Tax=Pseudoroseomonas ludipueritiae TaxID=198093 RepID=A0ABR7R5U7_9PROT|nr:CoA ester lyase [Pseudoroseomonas ludipueritiae]MBC9177042.1 CoA ester lyase [Pseudoroseomonas ludipueritiae]